MSLSVEELDKTVQAFFEGRGEVVGADDSDLDLIYWSYDANSLCSKNRLKAH